MDFNDLNELKNSGFVGFKTMRELFLNSEILPKEKGVYLILNLNKEEPVYLPLGTGGFFKGNDPNVSIEILKSNWVEKTIVVYIGKAGNEGNEASLKSRLKQYFGFGQGKDIGHRGGRYIWQLTSSRDLVVCWKTLPNDDPRVVESNLLKDFIIQYGMRPFANLVG